MSDVIRPRSGKAAFFYAQLQTDEGKYIRTVFYTPKKWTDVKKWCEEKVAIRMEGSIVPSKRKVGEEELQVYKTDSVQVAKTEEVKFAAKEPSQDNILVQDVPLYLVGAYVTLILQIIKKLGEPQDTRSKKEGNKQLRVQEYEVGDSSSRIIMSA